MDCAVSGGEWRPPSLFSSSWQRFTAFLDSVGVLRIRMLRFTRDVPFLAFALLRHWLPCLPFEGIDHTKQRKIEPFPFSHENGTSRIMYFTLLNVKVCEEMQILWIYGRAQGENFMMTVKSHSLDQKLC